MPFIAMGGQNDIRYQTITIGKLLSSYAAGSIVKIKESGTLTDFMVLKHGYVSGGTLVWRRYIDTNLSGSTHDGSYQNVKQAYQNSTGDKKLNEEYLAKIDSAVRNRIMSVNIDTCAGRYAGWGTMTISRKVFQLSPTELGSSGGGYSHPTYGSKIDYFSSNERRIKTTSSGSARGYGTRAPELSSDIPFWMYIGESGNFARSSSGSNTLVPAFVLPSSIVVNASTNEVIG